MITDTTTAAAVAGNTAAKSTPSQAKAVLSSDFETFLKMLTAQARNQDPLEPIDSTEYAAQLAQFSMVEQQVLSNDLLSALSTQLGIGGIGQLAGWIGMEALSDAPAQFDGSPIEMHVKPDPTADEAFLVVRNDSGVEVQRSAIPTAGGPIAWAGVSDNGRPFARGQYSFEVESRTAGQVTATDPVSTYARVTEARVENGQTVLVLGGGATVTSSQVTGLREPSTTGPTSRT